jgi:hypothetical protein
MYLIKRHRPVDDLLRNKLKSGRECDPAPIMMTSFYEEMKLFPRCSRSDRWNAFLDLIIASQWEVDRSRSIKIMTSKLT